MQSRYFLTNKIDQVLPEPEKLITLALIGHGTRPSDQCTSHGRTNLNETILISQYDTLQQQLTTTIKYQIGSPKYNSRSTQYQLHEWGSTNSSASARNNLGSHADTSNKDWLQFLIIDGIII